MNNWLLHNCRLPSASEPLDILIQDGKIKALGKDLNRSTKVRQLDLEGRLVVPGFVDSHMHLDKAFALDAGLSAEETLDEAIRSFFQWAASVSASQLYQNARRVVEQAILHGTVALRTHVTVDDSIGTYWLEPLAKLKDEFKPYITIQLVAFLDTSIIEDASSVLEVSRSALAAGADLIGGSPYRLTDYRYGVDALFDVAMDIGCNLDLHIDESDDPIINSLEYLAEQKMARRFPYSVTAGHCCSLSAKDEATAARIIGKVAQAGINVITLPSCNMMLMGRHDLGLIRRGLTRVRELVAAGVNVAYASDNIRDAFNPYGKADMLQEALITAHAIQVGSPADFDMLLAMGTYNPARILGMQNYGLEPGCWASLVVLDDTEWSSAVAREAVRSFVFSCGQVTARTEIQQNLFAED